MRYTVTAKTRSGGSFCTVIAARDALHLSREITRRGFTDYKVISEEQSPPEARWLLLLIPLVIAVVWGLAAPKKPNAAMSGPATAKPHTPAPVATPVAPASPAKPEQDFNVAHGINHRDIEAFCSQNGITAAKYLAMPAAKREQMLEAYLQARGTNLTQARTNPEAALERGLAGIAAKYGITVDQARALNRIVEKTDRGEALSDADRALLHQLERGQ